MCELHCDQAICTHMGLGALPMCTFCTEPSSLLPTAQGKRFTEITAEWKDMLGMVRSHCRVRESQIVSVTLPRHARVAMRSDLCLFLERFVCDDLRSISRMPH